MRPLSGIRVIEFCSVAAGPFCAMLLADMGADVIKVEALEGDITRQIGPTRHPGMGPVFLNANRSKRSIALDLKQDAGREVLARALVDERVGVAGAAPRPRARRVLTVTRSRKRSTRSARSCARPSTRRPTWCARPTGRSSSRTRPGRTSTPPSRSSTST